MRQRAFTLIELLVVIAIIAILAAILFPVFAKARERAQTTTCLNNMKQLGTAFQMYVQDTDGRLPHWCDYAPPPQEFRSSSQTNTTWDVYIYPYVKTKQSYTCPSNKSAYARRAAGANPIRSYSMPQNVSGMPMSYAKDSARTVLLVEKGNYVLGVTSDAPAEWFGQTVDGYTNVIASYPKDPKKWGFPHRDGKNFLFIDSHASWYPGSLAPSESNPFGYNFGPFPSGLLGVQRLGYCGPLDGVHAGHPGQGQFSKYGANLPK
jgi:prepilin-type N-terminal cleavage/methylation domain-containing protein